MGRQNRTLAPDGTITRLVLDARGNTLETWVGTNDTGATDTDPTGGSALGNNMVKVSSFTFDAHGNLNESREHFGSGANDHYAALYQYDWRDRLTDVLSPGDMVAHYEYDNLARATWTKTYASDDFTLAAGELRAQTNSRYDALGRVYESRVYEVDPDDGTVSNYLPSQTWHDARGYVVKTATSNGLFQKYSYDGLGRLTVAYTSFDLDEEDYEEALDVAADTVIEQTRTWYDQAGQALATATYQRLPDDTSTTGVLDAAYSYATASVIWYDGLGRTVATANYGREDVDSGLAHYFFDGTTGELIDQDENGIPDIAEGAPPEPYPQDPNSLAGIDFQLQLVQYDSAGRANRSTDNLGRIHQTDYDDAGRTVRTIQNYDDGEVDETDTDQDVTVEYQYDSGGRLVTMTAYNAKGSGNGVQAQATKYLYTSAINASWQTTAVYPDSEDELSQNETTKVWTITTDNSDHVSTTYDRLGRTTSTTDQRGVVHQYTFHSAVRLAHDRVTELGESGIVDDGILRITKTYDDIGRLQTVTSYDDPDVSEGSVVNQVKCEYNGWGCVAREYQEHDGAVDQYTPCVDYAYSDDASGGVAKYVRLSQVTYPNGREVHFGYGQVQAIDDIMSRLASVSDSSGTHSSFKYLGAKQIVEEDYSDIDVKLSYLDGSGNVTGLDRFARVVDQVWKDYGVSETLDEYTYTYDRAGNRTSRDNELHSAFDEDYLYDALNRLTDSDRADAFDQSWTLDGLGNFLTFDDDGTSQNRTVNAANQIQTISGSWVSPEYDAAGSLIFAPKSGDETTGLHFVRDAWNRLTAVYEDDGDGVYEPSTDDALVAQHEFDGQNRRIEKTFADDTRVEYFYNQQWQLLEEWSVDYQGATRAVNQYLWSPRYIDAPVVRFHDGNGEGDLLDAGDSTYYYAGDANFNVTATIDAATGDVVNRYAYSAYGEPTVYSPTWTSPTGATEDGPLYCGYWFDSETGNFQVRARGYVTCLSTFDATDPLVYRGGDFNLYAYCGNEPLNHTDPTGKVTALGGCAVGGAASAGTSFLLNLWNRDDWRCASKKAACAGLGGCIQGAAVAQFGPLGGCIGGALGSIASAACEAGFGLRGPLNACDAINLVTSTVLGCLGSWAKDGEVEETVHLILGLVGVNTKLYTHICHNFLNN